MNKKIVSLVFKNFYEPFNEKDQPFWEQHCLLYYPIPEFNSFRANNPQSKLDISLIGEDKFNEIFTRFSQLNFVPEIIFSNMGDLQNWSNFHIHAIAGKKLPDRNNWSIFDIFLTIEYITKPISAEKSFPIAELEGSRSFSDSRVDKVLAIDISSEVIKDSQINYTSLIATIEMLTGLLQEQPYEKGTISFIPINNGYRVVYIIKPTKIS